MALNPLGFVQVNDFGNPKILQGTARESISAGQIVGVSGATGVVSSGLSSYQVGDVQFIVSTDPENAVGVAIQSVSSGAEVGALIDGLCLMSCAGSVFAGRLVKASNGNGVANLGSQSIPTNAEDSSIAGNIFGRSYTAGASGGFSLIHVKP